MRERPSNYFAFARSTNFVISGGQLNRSGIIPERPRLTCITVGGK